jgi:choline kinase
MSKNPLVVILGAGKPFVGDAPSAIAPTIENKRVLDWQVEAFSVVPGAKFHFVGGYKIDEVIASYPALGYTVNKEWRDTGSVGSLALAVSEDVEDLYVCYSDTVFRRHAVELLQEESADVVFGVDYRWKERYSQRAPEDLANAETVQINDLGIIVDGNDPGPVIETEFTGIIRLRGDALREFRALVNHPGKVDYRKWSIPGLLSYLRDCDGSFKIQSVDFEGNWSELNAPQDLARFVLGTKAETLDRLRPILKSASIEEQVSISVKAWRHESKACLAAIEQMFKGEKVIVRSSALSEDCWNTSNAGGFDSVLDVDSGVTVELIKAIDQVVSSYGDSNMEDQVLVQRMLRDVTISGVVFTRTLDQGAPYYVVNYDDETASTDSVTSGQGESLRTVMVLRSERDRIDEIDTNLGPLISAIVEIEGLVGYDSLDIEFAVTSGGRLHILQVRPIAVTHQFHQVGDEQITSALDDAKLQFRRQSGHSPYIVGAETIFAVMPDWNPAEIVGTKPRPLALSLYQHLITNEVWAQQRAEYGYRDVRPQPLILGFQGHPFVDVRASFNSFIPEDIDDELASKLVEHYLAELRDKPHLHDKVEFDILFTCWFPDIHDLLASRLPASIFSEADRDMLESSLVQITVNGIQRIDEDRASIMELEARYAKVLSSKLPPLELACCLIEECKRFGTPAFSHLARAGFVAVTILKSLVRTGAIAIDEFDRFMNSLETVTGRFEFDASRVASGDWDLESFVDLYGHLRPGTYDITSEAYFENPEKYLQPIIESASRDKSEHAKEFKWSGAARDSIDASLRDGKIPIDADAFARFAKSAIEGREWAKFVFTRSLSAALNAIRRWAEDFGMDRDAASFLDFHDILQLRSGLAIGAQREWAEKRIMEGRASYRLTRAIELPPILFSESDFELFERKSSEPNFVTSGRAVANVHLLAGKDDPAALSGNIVLIPQADPGFDWIFGSSLIGLVTMYGGANSHMAIRAAELGLPAAIGVGEKLFEMLSKAEVVELDCASKIIRINR